MYRQTTSEIAPSHHRQSLLVAIAGIWVAWIGYAHTQSPPVLAGGLIVAGASLCYRYINRSRPLPSFTDGYITPEYGLLEETVPTAQMSSNTRQMSEEIAQCDEVQDITVRPFSPGEQFLEVQLSGGRVSNQLQETVEEYDADTEMRHPSSENYYTFYVFA